MRLPAFIILACAAAGVAAQTPTATSTPSPPTPSPPGPPPPVCTTPEHRQFDFWVGRWDVYPTGTDRLVAHSVIESLYAGCAIRENWMPLRGQGGGSLNSWRPAERRWRQIWADSSNSWTEYVGGIEDGAMVLTATGRQPNGEPMLVRMRYTREADGAVRQAGSQSTDGGATWTAQYDFTYRPAAPTPPPRIQ